MCSNIVLAILAYKNIYKPCGDDLKCLRLKTGKVLA